MHTVGELLALTKGFFADRGLDSPRLDAELLLAFALGVDRVQLFMQHERPLDEAEVAAYRALVKRRAAREPVAYITGEREFWALPFEVSPDVLVPRPATETLVEVALDRIDVGAEGLVLDVGTGSGCIAVAIAHARPGVRVIAIDVSPGALAVAAKNVARHGLDQRVELRAGDLLAPLTDADGPALALLGNPPYIRRDEGPSLMPEVRDHEPDLALYGDDDDGLGHHRRLLAEAASRLVGDGFVALEIGATQSASARDLPTPGLAWSSAMRDLEGHERVAMWTRA